MQREARQRAERPDRPRPVAGAQRARGVLHQRQTVAAGELEERIHVGRQAQLVHRHDRLRAGRDGTLGGRRIEVVGARVHVREDGGRAVLPDGVRGGDERQRRHDHLVPRSDARDVERELQRGRAVRRRHRLGRADACRERLLELAHARTLRDPARRDHVGDGDSLVAAQVGTGERDLDHAASLWIGTAGAPLRSARHHSTSRVRPASRSTSASKPSRSRARLVSASRRVTPLTARAGPCTDRQVGAHHGEQLSRPAPAGSSPSRWRR